MPAGRALNLPDGDSPPKLLAMLRRDPFSIGILVFALAIIAGLWIVCEAQIAREREIRISDVMRENANLARVFEEHTIRTLGYVDELVLSIKKNTRPRAATSTCAPFTRNCGPTWRWSAMWRSPTRPG